MSLFSLIAVRQTKYNILIWFRHGLSFYKFSSQEGLVVVYLLSALFVALFPALFVALFLGHIHLLIGPSAVGAHSSLAVSLLSEKPT